MLLCQTGTQVLLASAVVLAGAAVPMLFIRNLTNWACQMDFGTARQKLDRGEFCELSTFKECINSIFTNAMIYNPSEELYFKEAKRLQQFSYKLLQESAAPATATESAADELSSGQPITDAAAVLVQMDTMFTQKRRDVVGHFLESIGTKIAAEQAVADAKQKVQEAKAAAPAPPPPVEQAVADEKQKVEETNVAVADEKQKVEEINAAVVDEKEKVEEANAAVADEKEKVEETNAAAAPPPPPPVEQAVADEKEMSHQPERVEHNHQLCQAQEALDEAEVVLGAVALHSQAAVCTECGGFGESQQMLACVDCAEVAHVTCLEMELDRVPDLQQWRCVHCKVCVVCKSRDEEHQMIFCDKCDQGCHTFCTKPALKEVPTGRLLLTVYMPCC